MANVKISALPTTTATTLNDYVVKNDASNTITSNAQIKNVIGLKPGTGTNSIVSAPFLTTGTGSKASGQDSIAIGRSAEANGQWSIAIGGYVEPPPGPRDNFIAIGGNNYPAQDSIGIGYNNFTQSQYAVGIGNDVIVYSDGGTALGYNARVLDYKQNQIAIGRESTTNGQYAITLGYRAFCDADGGLAMGRETQARDIQSVALGFQNEVSVGALYGISIGSISKVDGIGSIGIGRDADVAANNAIAIGLETDANSFGSICIGALADITGTSATNAIAIGYNSQSNHSEGYAFGGNITTDYSETFKTRSVQSTGQFFNAVQTYAAGTSFDIDFNLGANVSFTINGNATCQLSNVRDGAVYRVKITNTGGFTLTPSATGYTFIYESGFALTANGTDLCVLYVFGSEILVTHFADFT
jgi:hypothetical protein